MNRFIVASAGSGKTTLLAREAVDMHGAHIVLLTYTNSNVDELISRVREKCGVVPSRIEVMSWFTFLLRECARPYQRAIYSEAAIGGLCFCNARSAKFVPRSEKPKYYFNASGEVFSDKISEFTLACNEQTSGAVLKRLGAIYDAIFIDEVQDLAGYDLDVVELLLRSSIRVILVGDPRQKTYTTNQALRNRQFQGIGLLRKAMEWQHKGLCRQEAQAWSYRCNQEICNYADKLYPDLETTISRNCEQTGHDGVFIVTSSHLQDYVRKYAPAVLRYDKRTDTHGHYAVNFGNSKGRTFDRVLILPHGRIKEYLRTGKAKAIDGSREKFYVAVTRAKFSVAFLFDEVAQAGYRLWEP